MWSGGKLRLTRQFINYVPSSGIIYLNVGAEKAWNGSKGLWLGQDAVWRTKGAGATIPSKKPEDFKVGEEVELIVTRVDAASGVLEVAEPGAEVIDTGGRRLFYSPVMRQASRS